MDTFYSKIKTLGGQAYWVGGCVRDSLLGMTPKDKDLVITGVSVPAFVSAFPEAEIVCNAFPIFVLQMDGEKVEVAFARKERKAGVGYRGFEIFTSPEVTIEEDLLRRDLTINAIAKEVLTGKIVDPFNGVKDLQKGILRAVSPAFAEDPLRVYRVARFAAKLGFSVAPETLKMMTTLREELLTLSVERVFEELRKALASSYPDRFFRVLADAQVLDVHFPELDALRGVPQPAAHHPEGDAFEHTMQVLKAAAELSQDEVVRFSALVHDLGKGVTPREKWPHHHGHEKAGVPLVEALASRLRLPKRWKRAGTFAAENHMKVHRLQEMRPVKIVDLISSAQKNPLGVHGLTWVALADQRGRGNPKATHPEAMSLLLMAEEMNRVVVDYTNLNGQQRAHIKRLAQAAAIGKLRGDK